MAESLAPDPTDEDQLDDALSAPAVGVVEMMCRVPGDILFLGVGGKMGPTMARMAKRASDLAGTSRRIIGVSRFSSPALPEKLNRFGIETIRCDLLDEASVQELPETPHVVSMSGFKFGAQGNPSMTWAMNCYVPAIVSRRFRKSRIVVFSSGNIYPFVAPATGGSREVDEPGPVGEYAISVLGRERIYEYFSRSLSIPMAVLRLNYATELRYGVLVDLARSVWNNEPIDVTIGHVNVIWQAEANAMSLRMLEYVEVPPKIVNIAGHEILGVREVCEHFGRLLGRQPQFRGTERSTALLNNASLSHALFGKPQVNAEQMIHWTAAWIRRSGASLDKPTHFNSQDGKY